MSVIKFAPPAKVGESFSAELKRAVDGWFDESGRSRNAPVSMKIKGVLMLTLLYGSFAWLLLGNLPGWAMLLLCVAIGLGYAGVGFCVGHDAIHGAYFKDKRWNTLTGYCFDLMGASSYLWRLTHNRIHHTWTNIPGIDEDIDVSPQIRHSPGAPRKWYHRLQHLYAWPLYALATVNWILVKDYQQLFRKKLGPYEDLKHPRGEIIKLFAFKLFHYGWSIALPLLVMDITFGQFLLGFLVAHAVAGLVLGVVFQLAHVVEEAVFPVPGDNGAMGDDWHAHQLRTTCDFATRNPVMTWYTGGLNHQIEHHLFPRICSAHYPALRPLVKRIAQKHGLPHYEAPTFFRALGSHYRMLRRLGRDDVITPAVA